MAFVEVLLPESATPIQPRMGATMMNQDPILENPYASDPAMPEKLNTNARPKIKTPTRQAPQHLMPRFLDYFPELDGV